jgi:osmotically-inducible protein OsmY
MKTLHSITLIVAAAALLTISIPVMASDIDSRIESSAKESYVFRTFLQSDDINIHSEDGAVTLTGFVANESHKSLARETVTGLPGVTSVDNRLEVLGEMPPENSDGWIKMKVESTLLFHRSMSVSTTGVDVKNGIVTLRGNVSSEAQKELTTEYVKDVAGVKYVINEMRVTKNAEKARSIGDKIDDASITAQVKMTLLYHRSTSALNTSVTTKNGVVILSGKARNEAELHLATKLANDVYGVNGVKNLMTIE